MYTLKKTSQFKTDIKTYRHNKEIIDRIELIVGFLLSGEKLPEQFRDHSLQGNYAGYRECHIYPNVLLIYKIIDTSLVILAVRIGSHSELF